VLRDVAVAVDKPAVDKPGSDESDEHVRPGTAARKRGTPAASHPRHADEAQTSTAQTNGADDVDQARIYLQRVENEHPGTPWSLLAQLELDSAVAFEWKEAFIVPPAGEKLPWDKKPWTELSDKQKEAKKKFERFQLEKKQKQEEQVKAAKAAGKEPTKIPKL
jgi:hypothetical protein